MCKTRLLIWALLPAALTTLTWAHLAGPPAGHSGAPGEGTCADAGCHDSYGVNAGPGDLVLSVSHYTPTYDSARMHVELAGTPGQKWGFQARIFEVAWGNLFYPGISDPQRTQVVIVADTIDGVTHTEAGTQDVPSWAFWTVTTWPGIADGPCPYLFVAAVAADGDGTPAGDYVYVDTLWYWTGLCACGEVWFDRGDLNLNYSITSADIILLVGMVFKGEPLPEPCFIGDVNCDLAINSADIIFLVNTVFKAGPRPCWDCLTADLLQNC